MSQRQETLFSLHREKARSQPHHPAIAFKKNGVWQRIGWQDYFEQAQACAAALVASEVRPNDRVGLLSENRPEWPLADMGAMACGSVLVPLHATLSPEQIEAQLRDAGVRWLFVSHSEQLKKICAIHQSLPELAGITIFDAAADHAEFDVEDRVKVLLWSDWLRRGRRDLQDELARRQEGLGPDSLATIVYTSGTTGKPKGVMLTHGNLLSSAHAVHDAYPSKPDSSILSWLPLSHIAARTVDHLMTLLTGGTIFIAESPDKLLENIAEVRPTHLSGVPRFYEKVQGAAKAAGNSEWKSRLRAFFGPSLDWLACGSAPLPNSIAQGFADAGLPIYQAYGLTETSGALTGNRPESNRIDTVGKPLPGLEVKIASDGEVLARGPNVTIGFWNDLAATQAAIRDGWLHTGDLGSFDDDGFLTITGRKKDLVVLSNGKKIVPVEIESLIASDPFIEHALVYGDGRSFLTAVVVPNSEIRSHLSNRTADDSQVARGDLDLLSQRIGRLLSHMPPEMQVKRFLVLDKELSVAGGDLTETLKPRRDAIFAKYKASIDRLYSVQRDQGMHPVGVLAAQLGQDALA